MPKRCLVPHPYYPKNRCWKTESPPHDEHRTQDGKVWRDVLREHETFANFGWLKRWSGNKGPAAMLSQDGTRYHIVTALGVVYADKDDLPYIAAQLETAVNLLKKEMGNR